MFVNLFLKKLIERRGFLGTPWKFNIAPENIPSQPGGYPKFEKKSQPRMPAGALFWPPFQRLFAGVPWR